MNASTQTAAPTVAQLVERASALVPMLRERALKAEADRGISAATHAAFVEAGFYRIFLPRRYGGYEMPWSALVDIGAAIARGCGSSAWVFTNLAGQNSIVGCHDPRALEEVWGANPDALIASSFPAKGGAARRVPGGIVLNGVWSFASGVDFADWENLQAFVPNDNGPPEHRFVLVPKSQYRILDDWQANGLAGTGSRSVVLDEVFVPEHRLLDARRVGEHIASDTPAATCPLFRIPPFSGAAKMFSSVAIGIARGALELTIEDVKSRRSVGGVALVDLPTAQIRIAESSAEIDAAYTLIMRDADEAMRIAERAELAPIEVRTRWRLNNAFAGQLCVRAVERLHTLTGARGIGRDSLFHLAVRDVHACVQQITMQWDTQMVNAGRVQLGLPTLDPRM